MKIFMFLFVTTMVFISSCSSTPTMVPPTEPNATQIQLPALWTPSPESTQEIGIHPFETRSTMLVTPSVPTRLPFITWTPSSKPTATPSPYLSPIPSPQEPTPTDPACAGIIANAARTGQRILFGSNRDGNQEIYIMNLDGSGLTNLTMHIAEDWDHQWSPSGDKISFLSDREGGFYLYIMNRDGSNPIRITNITTEYKYEWSPIGKKIAFLHEEDGQLDIYVVNLDGTGLLNLTQSPDDEWNFVWSHDGQKIAFESMMDGDNEIYVINKDGTGMVQLTHNHADDFNPVWSPNDGLIVFTSNVSPDEADQGAEVYAGADLYTVKPDGSDLSLLTTDPNLSTSVNPVWSHDGSKILFTSLLENRVWPFYAFIINVDGAGLMRLSELEAMARMYFAWSPDGSRIAMHYGNSDAWDPAGDTNAVFNADGSNLHLLESNILLETGNSFVTMPIWTADNEFLVFASGSDENDFEDSLYPAGYGINIIHADGACFTRLTNTGGVAQEDTPLLSPP